MLYLSLVRSGQWFMSDRKPWKLSVVAPVHNTFLAVVSAVLLMAHLELVVPAVRNYGVWHCLCSFDAFTPRLAYLYYLNYVTKFYEEFVDTGLLVLKRKDPGTEPTSCRLTY